MKREEIVKKIVYTLMVFLILNLGTGKGQTAGNIFAPNPGSPVNALDPDADGDIVANASSFSSQSSEFSQFEGEWTKGYQQSSEPSGDISGKSCGTSDCVDANSSQSAYFVGIYDPDGYPADENGNEYFMFRLRVGKDPKNSQFGYSVLIDSDQAYAGNDPNQVSGNDGFEYEIRLANGGGSKDIYLDSVDGTTNGTQLNSYDYSTHHIRSYADKTSPGCTNDAVFIDIAVPYADIPFNPSTSIRVAGATSSNGTSVLDGKGTDIAGLDDNNFTDQSQALKDLISSQSGTTLPVELIEFKALTSISRVNLKWTTASETNNSHFLIQKKGNDEWNAIGRVEGNGTTTRQNSYNFSDNQAPDDGTVYYRLKQVDFDGSFNFSDLKAAKRDKQALVTTSVYPNPASEKIFVELKLKEQQNLKFTIRNMEGKAVFRQSLLKSGNSLKAIQVNNFQNGLYILDIEGSNFRYQKRFLKQ